MSARCAATSVVPDLATGGSCPVQLPCGPRPAAPRAAYSHVSISQRGCGIGDVPQLLGQFDRLSGVGERAGMVAQELRPAVRDHRQHGNEHAPALPAPGRGRAGLRGTAPARRELEPAIASVGGDEVAGIVPQRGGIGDVQVERRREQCPDPRRGILHRRRREPRNQSRGEALVGVAAVGDLGQLLGDGGQSTG